MLNNTFPSNTNRSKQRQTPDSAAPIVSHRRRCENHLVNQGCVVKQFNRVAEVFGLSNGMQDIDAGVAVAEATVVVGGDIQCVRVANLKKSVFCVVLVIHDDVAFNDGIITHVPEFTTLLQFAKLGGSIPEKSASILVARGFNHAIKSFCEGVVNAEGENFAHKTPTSDFFIIISLSLIIRFH